MLSLVQAVILMVFPALLVVAALRDVTSYTIPNWISAALVVGFFPAALVCGLSFPQVGVQLAVGACALLTAMAMFALGWIGGGDAKLFAATALWLNLSSVGVFLMITAVAGGGLAIGLLAIRSDWLRARAPQVTPGWAHRLMRDGEAAPYGVAIAIGGLAAWPMSTLAGSFQGIF